MQPTGIKSAKRSARPKLVHQFLLVLSRTDPLVWRHERRGWDAPPAMYAYDFGDDWEHVLVHEGMESAEESLTYPRCVSGARRCPPEDCGGVHGYAEFLQTIADPDRPEHESMLRWSGGADDPDAFISTAVVFDDPRKRWKKAFER